MAWNLKGSYVETGPMSALTPLDIVPFGIAYEGKTGLSTSEFSWAV